MQDLKKNNEETEIKNEESKVEVKEEKSKNRLQYNRMDYYPKFRKKPENTT